MSYSEVDHERLIPAEVDEDEVGHLKSEIRRLEDDNRRLSETVDRLQQQMAIAIPEPIDAHYTIKQFMVALAKQRGRTYAWKKDYTVATEQTPGSLKVSIDDIQKWQKEKLVPEQAYVQIDWLTYPTRVGKSAPKPKWSEIEIDYLVAQYEIDPRRPNALLAEKCSVQFTRSITEDAVKGALFRLGECGRLPKQRPERD
jgi:hypothetical protein